MTNTQMTQTFESLTEQYGTYTKDGADYAITQNPYVNSGTAYVAHGYDRAGNDVRLTWEITNTETEDESEACDWAAFEVEPQSGNLAPWHPANL